MEYDSRKVEEAALALLWLTAHELNGTTRAWKNIDWEATVRLHKRGLIEDPRNAAKSVVFTEAGLAEARRAAERLFGGQ
jgi:Domain of unknown function (DUF6429)